MIYARPELELKLRAPLAGGEPGTREFRRATSVVVGDSDTCDFITDGVADDVEIDAALTYVATLGGGEVLLLEATYTLADPINFAGNNTVLRGLGRNSFIDGDGLATGEHGIVLSGYTDCVIADLSIQTEDGGGKTCHCIFIENGSDRFTVEHVMVVASDVNGIHIEGTDINYGLITKCDITACDADGIYASMDAANYLDYVTISLNKIRSNGSDGVHFVYRIRYCQIKLNQINDNTGYGVNISDATSIENTVENNNLIGNTAGAINDLGTDTHLLELTEMVNEPNGNIGLHPSIVLTDGVPVYGTIEFIAPSNMQEMVSAGVVLVSLGTGNIRRWVISEYGRRCHDESYNVHDGSIDTATIAVTANELECIDVSGALGNLGPYDTVALQFGRAGQDALDTVDDDCYLLAFYMEYV